MKDMICDGYAPLFTQAEFQAALARGPELAIMLLEDEKDRMREFVQDMMTEEGCGVLSFGYWFTRRRDELLDQCYLCFNQMVDVYPFVMARNLPIRPAEQAARRFAPRSGFAVDVYA